MGVVGGWVGGLICVVVQVVVGCGIKGYDFGMVWWDWVGGRMWARLVQWVVLGRRGLVGSRSF